MTIAVFRAALLGAMAIGVPVAFALIFTGIVLMFHMGIFNPQIVAQNMISEADTFTLLAIPFFLLAGELMNAGGLSKRIIAFAVSCVGHIRGGLGIVAVIAAVIMASLPGSAAAAMLVAGVAMPAQMVVTSSSPLVGILPALGVLDLPFLFANAEEADAILYWHEDPVRMDSLETLKAYAPHSRAMVCASETLAYPHAFRDYLATGIAGVAMLDLSWCGGISEARKIAALAEAHQIPVAPHDCTGPVVFMASCHFSMHARNALVQESVRAFYTGWYTELVTALPRIERGEIAVGEAPGHGTELLPGLERRADAIVRTSRA